MWKAFLRYSALKPHNRSLFHRAVFLLPWIALSLRFRGFKKTQTALQKRIVPVAKPQESAQQVVQVEQSCRMVEAAGHYGFIRPTCLVESLTLWYVLQTQEIPASLRIGVRKRKEEFEAHAWVEYRGAALNQPGGQHQHYAAFDRSLVDLRDNDS